jgi:hypothetical protein
MTQMLCNADLRGFLERINYFLPLFKSAKICVAKHLRHLRANLNTLQTLHHNPHIRKNKRIQIGG